MSGDLGLAAGTLRQARAVTVLTGAGISAESGIPTFRDALNGLWAKYSPDELATPEAFERNPSLVWEWYASRREAIRSAEPNPGHLALAAMAPRIERFTLVTQNVDGLHQRAGSATPIELHGNILRTRCARDGAVAETWAEDGRVPPRCPRPGCRGLLRPDVIWFGEMLPYEALLQAHQAAVGCEVFLSIGTSNAVEPAASLPWAAARAGATVFVINTTDEGQRRGPGIHTLLGSAATVLPALVRAAWPEQASG